MQVKDNLVIGYVRVSTQEQGDSRNGLDAQTNDLYRWAATNGYKVHSIVEEVASGGLPVSARPVLAKALSDAKKLKARVVVSKLDRLSRDKIVASALTQCKNGVISIDLGVDADEFLIDVYAALGQKERKMISERTKAGLAAAKARGVILGNRTNLPEARLLGTKVIKDKSDQYAMKVRAPIQRMRECGMTLKEIAKELNEQGFPTPKGGKWSEPRVSIIISRYRKVTQQNNTYSM